MHSALSKVEGELCKAREELRATREWKVEEVTVLLDFHSASIDGD